MSYSSKNKTTTFLTVFGIMVIILISLTTQPFILQLFNDPSITIEFTIRLQEEEVHLYYLEEGVCTGELTVPIDFLSVSSNHIELRWEYFNTRDITLCGYEVAFTLNSDRDWRSTFTFYLDELLVDSDVLTLESVDKDTELPQISIALSSFNRIKVVFGFEIAVIFVELSPI